MPALPRSCTGEDAARVSSAGATRSSERVGTRRRPWSVAIMKYLDMSADVSGDGLYRYWLSRRLSMGERIVPLRWVEPFDR